MPRKLLQPDRLHIRVASHGGQHKKPRKTATCQPTRQKKAPLPEDLRREKAKAVIIETLNGGWSITKACKTAGVNRCTAYEWRDRDDAFRKAWDDAIVGGLDSIEDLVRGAGERDWRAGEAILKAKRPETWNPRQKADVTLNASEGLLAALRAIETSGRGLPAPEVEAAIEATPEAEDEPVPAYELDDEDA